MNRTNAAQRAYLKERRAKARAAGFCAVCCTRKPEPPFKNCHACRTGSRECERPTMPFCLRCIGFHMPGAHIVERRLLRRAM